MLRIDRTVAGEVAAPPSSCLDLLADVERYPSWTALIKSVEPLGDATMHLRAEVLGLPIEMNCELELGADRARLRRLPHDADDHERFETLWTLASTTGGCAVELRVAAALDAPAAAKLLRGRIERRLSDDLLADFKRAIEP
jgi:ribosome-associated toxin RatA of RatAB toxin-antitoxin module